MNTIRISVNLSKDEAAALLDIAQAEYRHPREQVHYFVKEGLQRYLQCPAIALNPSINPPSQVQM